MKIPGEGHHNENFPDLDNLKENEKRDIPHRGLFNRLSLSIDALAQMSCMIKLSRTLFNKIGI